MTEAEWNACTNPQPMLEFLRGKVGDRTILQYHGSGPWTIDYADPSDDPRKK